MGRDVKPRPPVHDWGRGRLETEYAFVAKAPKEYSCASYRLNDPLDLGAEADQVLNE